MPSEMPSEMPSTSSVPSSPTPADAKAKANADAEADGKMAALRKFVRSYSYSHTSSSKQPSSPSQSGSGVDVEVDVDGSSIEQSYAWLSHVIDWHSLLHTTKLPTKLLNRPPVRFIHDIVAAVDASTTLFSSPPSLSHPHTHKSKQASPSASPSLS